MLVPYATVNLLCDIVPHLIVINQGSIFFTYFCTKVYSTGDEIVLFIIFFPNKIKYPMASFCVVNLSNSPPKKPPGICRKCTLSAMNRHSSSLFIIMRSYSEILLTTNVSLFYHLSQRMALICTGFLCESVCMVITGVDCIVHTCL